MGLLVEQILEDPGQGPEFCEWCNNGGVFTGVSSWIGVAMVARKICCTILSQSRDCSG